MTSARVNPTTRIGAVAAAAALLLLTPPGTEALAAQEVAGDGSVCSLEGRRVRVYTIEGRTVTGEALGCSADGLEVRPDAGPGSLASYIDHVIPLASLVRVEFSDGFYRPVTRSTVTGGILGGVVFGGFAYLTGDDGGSCPAADYCVRLTRRRKTVAAAVAGVLLGVGGGLLHGFSQEVEIWKPFGGSGSGPSLSLGVANGWGGAPALAVRVR